MKRMFLVAALIWGGAGCAMVPNSVAPVAQLPPPERVTPGMTYAMVAAVMDAKVMVGSRIDPATGAARPIETQNLYSSEIVKYGGATYRVDRYILRPLAPGGRIIEAELFPVAYKDGLVVAKGRDGLAALFAPEAVSEPVKAAK